MVRRGQLENSVFVCGFLSVVVFSLMLLPQVQDQLSLLYPEFKGKWQGNKLVETRQQFLVPLTLLGFFPCFLEGLD